MKNILTYKEFIKEDYRDVAGCGSGGTHQDDGSTMSSNGGSNTIIDVIGYPTGDKRVSGTEEIKITDKYFGNKKEKIKRETKIEEEKKKRMRRKAYKELLNIDKKSLESMKHIKEFKVNEKTHDDFYPEIDVWFTKTLKLRCKIKESRDSIPYEVTIGGFSWNEGKGRKYEDKIIKKVVSLQSAVNREVEKIIKM